MRKAWVPVLAAVVLVNAAGCASVQKKFTRKKDETSRIPKVIYIEEGQYQKKFSNDYYYKTHYSMWKTWHDELLLNLDGNAKKAERCAIEAYNHLEQMSKYLNDEKKAQLKPMLDDMQRIMNRFSTSGYGDSERAGLRSELEKIKRLIANDFYYNKIKESVPQEQVSLDG
jgi:hypothetical protein